MFVNNNLRIKQFKFLSIHHSLFAFIHKMNEEPFLFLSANLNFSSTNFIVSCRLNFQIANLLILLQENHSIPPLFSNSYIPTPAQPFFKPTGHSFKLSPLKSGKRKTSDAFKKSSLKHSFFS